MVKQEGLNSGIDQKEGVNNGLPKHVAIVTDGHRRWARDNGISIADGYQEGSKRIGEVAEEARAMGIRNLTFWVLSPQNVARRDPDELSHWYTALRKNVLDTALPALINAGARIKTLGRLEEDDIPRDMVNKFAHLIDASKKNIGITVSFAFNYSGEAELEDALASMREATDKDISLTTFRGHLYTAKQGLPDPDWFIRPGGEKRTSGFMPIQLMNTELDLPSIKWPEFTAEEFKESIKRFKHRRRTAGGNIPIVSS